MVDIKCPACGAEGRVTKQKVMTRLVCRKCLRVFHVTESGRSVLGEPAPPKSAATTKSAAQRQVKIEDLAEGATKRLSSPSTWIVVGSVLLLVIGVATFSSWRPEGLEERAGRAAKAAVQGDLQTIEDVAASGTVTYMGDWYVSIRPQSDSLLSRPGSNSLSVRAEVKDQQPGEDGVEVIAWVSVSDDLERTGGGKLPDPTIGAASASSAPISLPMIWKYESLGGWRLDLKRSLELSKPAP